MNEEYGGWFGLAPKIYKVLTLSLFYQIKIYFLNLLLAIQSESQILNRILSLFLRKTELKCEGFSQILLFFPAKLNFFV